MPATALMGPLHQQDDVYDNVAAFSSYPDFRAEQGYRELDARARAVTADPRQRGAAGPRVLQVKPRAGPDHRQRQDSAQRKMADAMKVAPQQRQSQRD